MAGGLNAYGFASGDPVNYGDPFGLCPVCFVAGVVVGAGVGIIEGFTVAKIVGAEYTARDVLIDGTLGAVGAVTALAGSARYLRRAVAVESAAEIGQSAGRHSGFVANYARRSAREIQKGIRSLERVASQHEDKIRNPTAYIADFYERSGAEQASLLRQWGQTVTARREQAELLKGLLR